MQKGPRLSSRRTRRAMIRLGCRELRTTGKHAMFELPNGTRHPLPVMHPEIPRNLVRDVCRMGGIPIHTFERTY